LPGVITAPVRGFAADARLAKAHVEDPEAPELDAVASANASLMLSNTVYTAISALSFWCRFFIRPR
jgi:hypothetical protein